jgi:hypothetical protein
MNTYKCDDGNAEVEITADSAQDAAEEYVSDGDWGEIESTTWINVYVQEVNKDREDVGGRERCKVVLHPKVPSCTQDEHDWQSPHSIVGGLKENPGVHGHGGGVTIAEVCMHCGCERVTDTWAQDPVTGEQGLESVKYTPRKYQDEVTSLNEESEIGVDS